MKVVDASAIAAILFAEPQGKAIAQRLQGERLLAPVLLHFEVAQTCLKKMRVRPAEHAGLMASMEAFVLWGIELQGVDPVDVVRLAHQHGLTAYDASYLWLARELDAELITLDTALARAHAALSRPGASP